MLVRCRLLLFAAVCHGFGIPSMKVAPAPTRERFNQREVTMRFGKKDVKIRGKIDKMLRHCNDPDSIDKKIFTSNALRLSKHRMKKRLLMKIRRRAYALGYKGPILEEKLDDAFVDPPPRSPKKENVPVPRIPKAKKPEAVAEPVAVPEPTPEPEPVAVPEPTPEAKPATELRIADQVNDEVKVAMKAKDKIAVNTLRNIKTALASGAKDAGVEILDDADAVKVLRKLAKMRQESIDMYKQAGDAGADRADAEQAELDVINRWLPQYVNIISPSHLCL